MRGLDAGSASTTLRNLRVSLFDRSRVRLKFLTNVRIDRARVHLQSQFDGLTHSP
jgi:hypothetical protein